MKSKMKNLLFFVTPWCFMLSTYARHEDGLDTNRTSMKRFAESNNAFAISLYKRLVVNGGNVVFCPASISSSLALLMSADTKERSRAEFYETLNFKNSGLLTSEIKGSISELSARITSSDCLNHFGNGLFLQEEYEPTEEFKNDSKRIYNTEIQGVDFANDNQKATWLINEFVRMTTDGKIKRLYERVDNSNQMILVNVAHLRTNVVGLQAHDTVAGLAKAKFYNHGVQDHDLDIFMIERMDALYREATSYDFRALELPCGNVDEPNIKLWLFLPHKRGSLAEVEDGLSTTTFRQINDSLQYVAVDFSIPRIRFDFTKDISKDLYDMGIRQAFASENVNLFGVPLTQVMQRAVIDFNEASKNSSRSNSELSIALNDVERVLPFVADHPFLFFIMDIQAGLILYMGRVYEF